MGELKRFSVVQYKVVDKVDNNQSLKIRTFICINQKDGIKFPHPITNFIRQTYENKMLEPNTVRTYAEIIKGFLNYIFESIEPMFKEVKTFGLTRLESNHAINYINNLSYRYRQGEIKSNTIHIKINVLNKFYIWLIKQKLIDYKAFEYATERTIVLGKTIEKISSPLNSYNFDIILPRREGKKRIRERQRHDFGKGRIDLALLFLKVSKEVAPEITLGIAFQFFGGLRRGEVVNLLTSSFNKTEYHSNEPIILDVRDNWEYIFKDKRFDPSEQVKIPRLQPILKTNVLNSILNEHIRCIKLTKKKLNIRNDVLFCSYKSGRAISGRAYSEGFNKVKKRFLEKLLENNFLDEYNFLISKPWSTHIGRGIFTNILIFNLHFNLAEAALLRGDATQKATELYIEDANVNELAVMAIENLSKNEKELNGEL